MDIIQEINNKYNALEAEVNHKLEIIRREEEKLKKMKPTILDTILLPDSYKILNYEEAMNRNSTLLKSLEMSSARLRSLFTYSPLEEALRTARENYKMELEMLEYNNQPLDIS